MKKIDVRASVKDKRGTITDLLEKENINAVSLVSFKKGAVRGNHFHKKTWQWNYVLSGSLRLRARRGTKKPLSLTLKAGDFVLTGPGECHAVLALKDSEMMVFTKGPRGGKEYESDTYRMKKPLIKSRL